MNVICKEPKDYCLTKDKQYTIEDETRDLYKLKNDNGALVRYGKSLFTKGNSTENIQESKSIEEYLDTIIVDGNPPYIEIDDNLIYFELECKLALNSCGIAEFEGMNNLVDDIITHFPNIEDLRQRVFLKVIKHYLKEFGECLNTFSTNTNYNHFEIIDNILESISDYSTISYNLNSRNEIKLWIISE